MLYLLTRRWMNELLDYNSAKKIKLPSAERFRTPPQKEVFL